MAIGLINLFDACQIVVSSSIHLLWHLHASSIRLLFPALMDQGTQNLLSDREKGERLKEIFETLNKMKKRIERLKTTRSLTPAEMKEYADVSVKLGSFYEKCKNFIKTRKNGPGKFMIEEYLKWCSVQKSAQHRSTGQYRSSQGYIKGISKPWSHPLSPSQSFENSGSGSHFRGAHPIYHGKHPHTLAHGYSVGAKYSGKTGCSARGRVESPFFSPFLGTRSRDVSPASFRAGLGHIEPLHSQDEQATGLQSAYHYTSSKCSARATNVAQPVTVAVKRDVHPKTPVIDELETICESFAAPKATSAQQTTRSSSHQFDRGHVFGKKTVHDVAERQPKGAEGMGSAMYGNVLAGPFAKNATPPGIDPSHLTFGNGIQNTHAASSFSRPSRFAPHPDSNHPCMPHRASSLQSTLQSPIQFGHPLQHDQQGTLHRSALMFSPLVSKPVSPRNHSAGVADVLSSKHARSRPYMEHRTCPTDTGCAPHDFSFEFRFDNRTETEACIPLSGRVPGILRDEGCVSSTGKPLCTANTSKSIGASHDQGITPKHNLLSLKRTKMEDLIKEIDPESCLSTELRDCILIHLDSVMHRAAMISAVIASTKPGKLACVDDICLGFRKSTRQEFSACFKGQKRIEDDRDYTLHNMILETIENQKQ